ncbi:hypothetical protein JG687_00000075 [Phytophthora cactorum]|uniref:Uncharacterized protein n=1 Tax=Phytophthora cactorum TaxID=29920 RepID=A0A8T1V4L8_9STRA|nr:hypothetical protein PC123_g1256 [Phytophthora cactorum]KAG6974912.1 hypothetical protein JG687_00000075 [Phytophthora cactorum]
MVASPTTQLARVIDSSPILLTLSTDSATANKASPFSCIVVKIRPTLLHFLVGTRLWCVIWSKVSITDVSEYGNHHSEGGEARPKLLVSAADGNVWVVTLPGQLHAGVGVVTHELLLERSSSESDGGTVQWFCQLPGVRSVDHTPAGSGLASLTLMRSLVTPSTLIVSTHGRPESTLQRHQSLELDELEGEQSSCTLCLNGQVASHYGLLKCLFPDVANDSGVAAILQGDVDGCVRFSLVHYPSKKGDNTKASVVRSRTLLRLGEPVQMIVPFSSIVPTPPSSEGNDAADVFDALLVLGARGRIGVVELKNSCSVGALPVSMKTLELGRAVQSLVFVSSLAAFVFCSSGSAFVCRGIDILAKAQFADSEATTTLSDGSNISTEKLPLQPGIMRLATHGSEGGLSILFASGQFTTIDKAALHTMVTSVLPLPGQQRRRKEQSPTRESASESRVRNLLHRIAQISSESTALRTKSKQMDLQLKTLHSALEMLRLVDAAGVESVVKCDLRASMVMTGTFSDQQTIKLDCSFRFVNPEAIVSLNDWWLCLYVRTHQRAVTTYSFPLTDIAAHGELSVILDPDTLAQQDQGALLVSCSMVFCPSRNGYPENKRPEADHIDAEVINQEDPLSFAIPLLQDRRFLFAQLSQPIEEETPASQVAIHAAFRQNHEPFMPVGRATKEGITSSSTLWSGVQWWAALADHADKNPSFAALWSKIAPSDAAPLALTPPSRFVITIPSFFATEDEDEEDEDEDEDFEKVRVERIVSFLRQLLDIPIDEVPRLRRSCRTQHGKLWTVLRAFSGSLILLRFTPSEDQQRSVDLTIQCSDVADLSAMRALVLESINNWSDGGPTGVNDEDRYNELALDVSEMLEPIVALENLLEDLTLKVKSIEDPNSACCTDEVLHALSQLAHLETQTLTLYWKTRLHLNRTIM